MKNFVVNRYTICDSSGIGHDKWRYFMGDFGDDVPYARDYIRENLESWTLYGCSYSLNVELDVEAPLEFLEKKFEELNEEIEWRKKLIFEVMLEIRDRKAADWQNG